MKRHPPDRHPEEGVPVSIEEVLEHEPFLRRLAQRLSIGDDAPEDLVQDTLMKALRFPPRRSKTLRSWLATVMRNEHSQSRRRALLDPVRSLGELGVVAGGDEREPSVPEELSRREIAARLLLTLEGLPEPYRGTLRLRYGEELSAVDIAERLALPVETVRTRIKRGIAMLRSRVEREHRGSRDWLAGLFGLFRRRRSRAAGASAYPAWLGIALFTGAATVFLAGAGLLLRDRARLEVAQPEVVAAAPRPELARAAAAPSTRAVAPVADAPLALQLLAEPSLAPVEGAAVRLSSAGVPLWSGRTDAEGRVQLAARPGDGLVLRIDATADTAHGRVDLTPESFASELTVRVPSTCTALGRVIADEGATVPGVLVEAVRGTYPYFLDPLTGAGEPVLAADGSPLAVHSDEQGRFVLHGVPVDAVLIVRSEELKLVGISGRPERIKGFAVMTWRLEREREPETYLDGLSEITLRVHRAHDLRVRVEDADGRAVPRTSLKLMGSGFTYRLGTTDDEGRARFDWLEANRVLGLTAVAAGHGSQLHGPFVAAELDEYVVTLAPEAFVHGSVVDAHGKPLAAATVRIFPFANHGSPDGDFPNREIPLGFRAGATPAAQETGADGSFRFGGLHPGSYDLRVRLDEETGANFTATTGTALECELDAEANRSLRVRPAEIDTGEPICGATAELIQHAGTRNVRWAHPLNRDSCTFTLSLIDESPADLWVAANGHVPFLADALAVDDLETLDVPLYRGRSLRVRVLDVNGTPAAGVLVTGARSAGTPQGPSSGFAGAYGTTDAYGEVVLDPLPIGPEVFVNAWTPFCSRPWSASVRLDGWGDELVLKAEVELQLPRRLVQLEPDHPLPDGFVLRAFQPDRTMVLDWSRASSASKSAKEAGARFRLDPPVGRVQTVGGKIIFERPRVTGAEWLPHDDVTQTLPVLSLPAGKLRVELKGDDGECLGAELVVPVDDGAVATLALRLKAVDVPAADAR
ncbi:MAG: sigma-70 family RNA polymerase sigma factor [Planctomycetota bacterium]